MGVKIRTQGHCPQTLVLVSRRLKTTSYPLLVGLGLELLVLQQFFPFVITKLLTLPESTSASSGQEDVPKPGSTRLYLRTHQTSFSSHL